MATDRRGRRRRQRRHKARARDAAWFRSTLRAIASFNSPVLRHLIAQRAAEYLEQTNGN